MPPTRRFLRRPPGWLVAGALIAVLLAVAIAVRPLPEEGPPADAAARTVAASAGPGVAEGAARADEPGIEVTPERRAIARLSHARVAVTNGGGRSRLVALTFDDGPGPLTMNVLSVLDRLGVPATFYVQGPMIEMRPATMRAIAAGGHEIGVHGWTHADLTGMRRDDIRSEVLDTRAIIRDTAGVDPATMRPPYGAIDDRVLAALAPARMLAVLWDVDTEDWRGADEGAIARHVVDNASGGSIVLMHDGDERRVPTLRALPAIVAGLRAKGLRFATVSDLVLRDPPAGLLRRPAPAAPGTVTDGDAVSDPAPAPSSTAAEPPSGE